MNRSILIVICDFLLVSLLAFSSVDISKTNKEGVPRQMNTTLSTKPPDSQKDLTAVMRLALEQERDRRELLLGELTKTREAVSRQQALLNEREQQAQNLQQALQQRAQQAESFQQALEQKEQQANQLAEQKTNLQQQFASAQTNIQNLHQQLQSTSTRSRHFQREACRAGSGTQEAGRAGRHPAKPARATGPEQPDGPDREAAAGRPASGCRS